MSMKQTFHWIISIVAGVAIAVVFAAFLLSVGYVLYFLFVEGTALFFTIVLIGLAYGASSYIEKHGWAWSQHATNVEPAEGVK